MIRSETMLCLTSKLRVCRVTLCLGALALSSGCQESTTKVETIPPAAGSTAALRIDSFSGEYRFLSNFWPAQVVYEGITYPTAEHAYQSAKTLDMDQRRQIAELATPSSAKKAGRALQIRPDWEAVKLRVMEDCVRYKFSHDHELRQKLLATGDAELIEGNTWGDRFWGVCEGQGENHLGQILMKVRQELKTQEAPR